MSLEDLIEPAAQFLVCELPSPVPIEELLRVNPAGLTPYVAW